MLSYLFIYYSEIIDFFNSDKSNDEFNNCHKYLVSFLRDYDKIKITTEIGFWLLSMSKIVIEDLNVQAYAYRFSISKMVAWYVDLGS